MKLGCLLLAVLAVGVPALAQHSASEPVLDVSAMDRTDRSLRRLLHLFLWRLDKEQPDSPDQSSWDTYRKLQDENRAQLRTILEEAAKASATRDAVTQKIGDYYASCLDEAAIEKLGAAPLAPELKRIEALKSKQRAGGISRDRTVPSFARRRRNSIRLPLQPGLQGLDAGDRRSRSGRPWPSRS